MNNGIRLLVIILVAVSLCALAAYAQEGVKCTAVHEGPVGIFIDPTEEEREAMKKERSAEELELIFDDSMWYDYQAVQFLGGKGIPYCYTTDEKHEFVAEDGKKFTLAPKCDYWCMIIWNGRDEPLLIDSIDIDLYEDYLKGE